jgi:hypothetical protein
VKERSILHAPVGAASQKLVIAAALVAVVKRLS